MGRLADLWEGRRLAEIEDALEEDPRPIQPFVERWEDRRPSEPYLDLLETLAAADRMEIEGELIPDDVLGELPSRLPDLERVDEIRNASGWVSSSCPDAGDGNPHDMPKVRPYLTGDRWDPHSRAWNAWQGRGSTAKERFLGMAQAVDELGVVRLELTLPPELVPQAWGQIRAKDDRELGRLGKKFVEHLWAAFDLPGEPVGSWVCIHRTSSSLPHEIRPHLHVLAPAIYRDDEGQLQALEREHGSAAPLHRPREDLEEGGPLRQIWKDLLETWADVELDGVQNVNYGYLWAQSREDLAKLVHLADYNTRPHLRDVDEATIDVGKKWVRIDVSSNNSPRLEDRDTLLVPLDVYTRGVLSVQAHTPDYWQMSRWYGEIGHRKWARFADELGIPDPDDVENTWGELLEIGAEWAEGEPDRDRTEALAWIRDDLEDRLVAAAIATGHLDPPTPTVVRAAEWRIRERMVEWTTLPLAELCVRCGQRLETDVACSSDDVLAQAEAAIGDPPENLDELGDHGDTDPQDVSPAIRRWRLVDSADADRLRHDAIKWRMHDHELED